MRFIRSRFTSAHLIALLALFVALGGSAYAFHLGKGSVKTKNIKNGAVVESKLATGAVTNAKIAAGAVTSATIAAGAVGAENVRDVVVRSAAKPLPDNSNVVVRATCAPGERLVGGTGNVNASNSQDIVVTGATPTLANGNSVAEGQSPGAWQVTANNYPGGSLLPAAAIAYALCLQ